MEEKNLPSRFPTDYEVITLVTDTWKVQALVRKTIRL